jgi:hypothetical protein
MPPASVSCCSERRFRRGNSSTTCRPRVRHLLKKRFRRNECRAERSYSKPLNPYAPGSCVARQPSLESRRLPPMIPTSHKPQMVNLRLNEECHSHIDRGRLPMVEEVFVFTVSLVLKSAMQQMSFGNSTSSVDGIIEKGLRRVEITEGHGSRGFIQRLPQHEYCLLVVRNVRRLRRLTK